MVFCFVQNFFSRTTQELQYLFFLSCKVQFFFPEFHIRLYDKNSESEFFFFLHQNQNISINVWQGPTYNPTVRRSDSPTVR